MVMSKISVAAMIGPLTDGELANRKARQIVHAEHLGDAKALHHAVIDHLAAAAATFFGWLEDHGHGAGEVAGCGQVFGCTEKHGGVTVMSAGVHLAGGL
jgi:hypothetical protein